MICHSSLVWTENLKTCSATAPAALPQHLGLRKRLLLIVTVPQAEEKIVTESLPPICARGSQETTQVPLHQRYPSSTKSSVFPFEKRVYYTHFTCGENESQKSKVTLPRCLGFHKESRPYPGEDLWLLVRGYLLC